MYCHDTVVLLYAKAPVAGKVNTRLIPDIGVTAATQLQHDFIVQRLEMLNTAELCDVYLMCAPDQQHPCFMQCEKEYPVSLYRQSGSDLGERLANGIDLALENYKYCIVIGTDAPALQGGQIKQAIDALHKTAAVVFVPAEDGGYVLLGLQQNYHALFHNISWGSDRVMQQSRDTLKQQGIHFQELETCWDVDRIEDYKRYLRLMQGSAANLK